MKYKGDAEVDSAPYFEVVIFKKLLANKLPDLAVGKVSQRVNVIHSKEGMKYTETISRTHSRVAKLVYVASDLVDSRWDYPVISEKVVGTVVNATQGTHPEYVAAKNKLINK